MPLPGDPAALELRFLHHYTAKALVDYAFTGSARHERIVLGAGISQINGFGGNDVVFGLPPQGEGQLEGSDGIDLFDGSGAGGGTNTIQVDNARVTAADLDFFGPSGRPSLGPAPHTDPRGIGFSALL